MFIDTFSNMYLGLRKSKGGDKAKPIPKNIFIYSLLLEVG